MYGSRASNAVANMWLPENKGVCVRLRANYILRVHKDLRTRLYCALQVILLQIMHLRAVSFRWGTEVKYLLFFPWIYRSGLYNFWSCFHLLQIILLRLLLSQELECNDGMHKHLQPKLRRSIPIVCQRDHRLAAAADWQAMHQSDLHSVSGRELSGYTYDRSGLMQTTSQPYSTRPK